MSEIVYYVVPADGAWVVRMTADSLLEAYNTKSHAVERARSLAYKCHGRVYVLTASGDVELELA